MRNIHRAAAIRAYRTLATGLGGAALTVPLVAAFTEGKGAVPAIVAALGAVIVSSFASFFVGVAAGLPEVE